MGIDSRSRDGGSLRLSHRPNITLMMIDAFDVDEEVQS
jgi:hypothetical protein